MSRTPADASNTRKNPSTHELRSHQRFPISLDVQYRQIKRGRISDLGSGRTINISSGGILFAADHALAPGTNLEVLVNWPFLLEGVCPLKLVMRGRVVRSEGTSAAIQTSQHEFRTAGIRAGATQDSKRRSMAK